jgi:hypothetical protein
MSTTLLVSEILGRGVTIEWFEAIALVRSVAERVLDSVAGRSVPELDQVHLSADGTVTLSGANKNDEPVRRLGQFTQACLVQSEPPVQLRLLVSQATAPEPTYASIRELSEALGYFERPDRSQVLQGLWQRAQAAPATSNDQAVNLDAIVPLRKQEKPSQPSRVRGARGPKRAVAAVAAVVMLFSAAAAYSTYRGVTPSKTDVTEMATKATDAVGTTLVKGISAVTETVGLGRLVPADAKPAPPPGAPARSSVARRPDAPRDRTTGTTMPPFRVFDLPAVPQPIPAVPPIDFASAAVDETLQSTTPTIAVIQAEAVYSSSDNGVSPPIGVRPQLPRTLPADVSLEDLSQIELVIMPDGTVGSVKLVGAPSSVLDGLFLSAAKAWKFLPAQKDGRPVAYRKTVWLALQ